MLAAPSIHGMYMCTVTNQQQQVVLPVFVLFGDVPSYLVGQHPPNKPTTGSSFASVCPFWGCTFRSRRAAPSQVATSEKLKSTVNKVFKKSFYSKKNYGEARSKHLYNVILGHICFLCTMDV